MLSGTDRKAFWRKRLLISFAMFGSIATSSFLIFPFTTPSWLPPLAGALNIIGYTAYSITVVCQNAFLPILAAEELRYGTENEPLLQDKTVLSLATSRISSICFGMGCISACIGLATLEILLIILKGTNHALQLCIGLTGLWWGVSHYLRSSSQKGSGRARESVGLMDGAVPARSSNRARSVIAHTSTDSSSRGSSFLTVSLPFDLANASFPYAAHHNTPLRIHPPRLPPGGAHSAVHCPYGHHVRRQRRPASHPEGSRMVKPHGHHLFHPPGRLHPDLGGARYGPPFCWTSDETEHQPHRCRCLCESV